MHNMRRVVLYRTRLKNLIDILVTRIDLSVTFETIINSLYTVITR